MLTNRPEFHIADSAAISLGATPFSLYQTLAPDQIAYQLTDSGARDRGHRAGVPRQRAGRRAKSVARGRARVVVDRRRRAARRCSLRRAARRPRATSRRSSGPAATVEPDDLLTLIYTSGTTGPPKGVQITHGNMMGAVRGARGGDRLPRGLARRLVPADGAHRRAGDRPLPADRARPHRHLLPEPARGDRLPARGAPDLVLRRPAHLGEAEGGHRGDDRGRARRRAQARPEVGARRRPQEGAPRAGRQGRAARARGGARARRTQPCFRRCARSSGSTRRRSSTSAPRRRRCRCSSSSMRSGSRWRSSGDCPRAAAAAR